MFRKWWWPRIHSMHWPDISGVFATLYEDGLASPTGSGLGRSAPIHATQLVCTSVPNEPGSDEIGVCHLFSSRAKRPLLQLTSGPVRAACTARTARSPAPRKRPRPACELQLGSAAGLRGRGGKHAPSLHAFSDTSHSQARCIVTCMPVQRKM
jgi:hypothetical protein